MQFYILHIFRYYNIFNVTSTKVPNIHASQYVCNNILQQMVQVFPQ